MAGKSVIVTNPATGGLGSTSLYRSAARDIYPSSSIGAQIAGEHAGCQLPSRRTVTMP
jgi:hypothetical protein